MFGILLCALIVVLASVVVGRTTMLLLGWRRPEWLAGAVGLAVLVILAPFLVRLPGRGLTAAVVLALLTIACAFVTRGNVPRRGQEPEAAPRPRAQHVVALVVVPVVLAVACLPFAFNERTGVLGEGIYTNDQAAQLYWADWLADGFGPQPKAVQVGYPVGPQALVASVSEGSGVDLVDAFNGLLIAIPALTALVALSALAGLPPLRRGVAAALTGLPYLGASFLAQSGFKETAMALFVVGLAVALHLATRRDGGEAREAPPVRAVVGVVAILAAAAVFTFSIPGGVWFGVALPVWAILTWGFGESRLDWTTLREEAARHRRLLVAVALALGVLAAVALGPASGFIERIDEVQGSSGRLPSPVWPGEALGIWPEGDFRIVRGEVSGAFLATGFAALCALAAALALVRRREWALLATLVAGAFVYALSRPFAQIHVEAKALAVLAPVVMLITLRWLLAPADGGRTPAATARLVVGGVFVVLALGSTVLALRAAPVGFDDRQRDLEVLAERIDGESAVFLGVDRFAGYYLRGTLMESPGGYVPAEVDGRSEKVWQQGLALDFDTLSPGKLDDYRYAIATAAAYQSAPPPNWTEIAREGEYVLWERSGPTPRLRLADNERCPPGEALECSGGHPGAVLDCAGEDAGIAGRHQATVVAEPVVAGRWQEGLAFDAPGSATATAQLRPGRWSASLQYHSQVPLTVIVDGEEIATLPPGLEGLYLTSAGRGAFWPAGEVTADTGPATVEIRAAEPSALQDALGVERKVWLGTLALTRQAAPRELPLRRACGDYVDHYALDDRA